MSGDPVIKSQAQRDFEPWFKILNDKLDRILALEARIAVLEQRSSQHDKVADEVAKMRELGPLKEKVAALEAADRVTSEKVQLMENIAARHNGLGDGIKVAWFALAGAPGFVAVVLQLADMFRK